MRRISALLLALCLAGCVNANGGAFGRSYVELRDPTSPDQPVVARAVSSDNSCTILSYNPDTQEVWGMSAAQGMSVNATRSIIDISGILASVFGGDRGGSDSELVKVENCVRALEALYEQGGSSSSPEAFEFRLEVEPAD